MYRPYCREHRKPKSKDGVEFCIGAGRKYQPYRRGLTKWYRDMSITNPSPSDFLKEVNGKTDFNRIGKGELAWYSEGSRKNEGTGTGMCGYGTRRGSIVSPLGRAIAQAVSRQLPTAAAWVRPRVKSCGICGGQSGTGAGFLRVLRIPLQILIPPTAPHSSSIVRGWYNGPVSGWRTK
jgi:hypothetical protein